MLGAAPSFAWLAFAVTLHVAGEFPELPGIDVGLALLAACGTGPTAALVTLLVVQRCSRAAMFAALANAAAWLVGSAVLYLA